MSDLISRSALIEDLKSRKYIDKPLCEIFETIIDEQPVAYDMEKVVAELEEQAEENRKYWSDFDDEDSFGAMNAYMDAIKIVKGLSD